MVAYLEKWRIVHAAGCCTVDPFTRLATGIGLWRESRAVPFSEAERALFEAAMPHLVETFALNRIAHVLRMSQAPNAAHYASAVADAGGRLQAAPQQFLSLLRREWQDWRGPDLPADLGHFAAGEPRFVGREVFVRAARVDGLVLVQAREKRPADELTARELEIAHHVERGLSYRQIAARLGISAATVRTHLSAAYGKLAVRKQAELIARIAEAA
jgi:DNA-binding CsgD family transcriptional regulator